MTVSKAVDPLTQASVSIAWLIIANKPFYPVYVWWLVGSGVEASLWTLAGAPLFLAVPLLAKRSPLLARAALPMAGLIDTLFETKLFGADSGTELFLAACVMLAAVSFRRHEMWWQRAIAVIIFAAFAALHGRYGTALYIWSAEDLATFRGLNAFAVAGLLTFIAIRYAGIDRAPPPARD